MEKQTIIQMGDEPTVVEQVAEEIRNIVSGSTVSIVDEHTIQIIKDGVISSVRVRPNMRSAGYKVTHSGKYDWSEDKEAKVIGEAYNGDIKISKNKINAIASESTKWDRHNVANAMTQNWKADNKDITSHPSIVYDYYIIPYTHNEVIGMSAIIETPNTEEWDRMKKRGSENPQHVIPSGKVVMKIITNSDVEAEIQDKGRIRISGTIEQVSEIIKKIAGNPMEWGI